MKKLLVVAALTAMLFQSTTFADTPVSASHERAARELVELLGQETQMRKGAQLGATEAQAHIGELQEMIKQRPAEPKAAEESQ